MKLGQTVPGIPDAVVRYVDRLPLRLEGGSPAGPLSQAKPGQLLLVQPGVVGFLVSYGKLLEVAYSEDADLGVVTLFMNGSARAALIHQRGELPLHAAALVPPDGHRAIAVCGPSGAGKSTLAAELCRRGWKLVADDTSRITWDGSEAMVWPSGGCIKLWRDACDAANIEIRDLERVTRDHDKYYVPVTSLDCPVGLGAIVELTSHVAVASRSISEKMALVSRNTYRPSQILPLGVQNEHVRIAARVASSCTFFQLPAGRQSSVTSLADEMESFSRRLNVHSTDLLPLNQ